MIELLAPASSLEVLKSAVQAGCNAVYGSGKLFGARSYAVNFDFDELKAGVDYCHLHNVKFYLTINTLILEKELSDLIKYLDYIVSIHVDAVIVQDLGVIKLIKTKFPTLTVHASTQLNVYDHHAVKFLKQMGVERIIAARETSLNELKMMMNEGIEVETFVHGALCFSASGNCLLSSMIGGRSGNRGKCAQPCRKNYTLLENGIQISESLPILSMKDLCTIDHIKDFTNANVTSLKIEGRMKSKEYVYNVVKMYREAIDYAYSNKNYNKDSLLEKVNTCFNRPYTIGYVLEESNADLTSNDVNHQGVLCGEVINTTKNSVDVKLCKGISLQDGLRIKSKNELGVKVTQIIINGKMVKEANINDVVTFKISNSCHIGDKVYKTISSKIEQEVEDILKEENIKDNINVELSLYSNKPLTLKFKFNNNNYEVSGEKLEYSDNFLDENRIISQISKLTSTTYQINKIKIHTDYHSFVKISSLNEIRRKMVDYLDQIKLNNYVSSNTRYLLVNDLNKKINNINTYIINIECVTSTIEQKKICEKYHIKNIYHLNDGYSLRLSYDNQKMIHNLSQVTSNNVVSPYFNLTNSYSLGVMNDLGIETSYLSVELSIDDIKALNIDKSMSIGVFAYGRVDDMVSMHCVVGKNKGVKNKSCGNCLKNNYQIVDELGNNYPLLCNSKNCEMRILNDQIIDVKNYFNDLINLGITKFLLVFTNENENQVELVLNNYLSFFSGKKINKNEKGYLGHLKNPIL